MATRAKTVTPGVFYEDRGTSTIVWTGLLNGDDGDPVQQSGRGDRSVQVTGTYGAAGNVRIEGSNDGVNWVALADPQGTDLDIVAADKQIEQIMEITKFIRPRVTAGDGTTNLTVTLFVKGVR
jgi:hypothetical protein